MPVSLEKEEITTEQMGALARALSRTAQVFLDMAQTVKEFHLPPARTFSLVGGPDVYLDHTDRPPCTEFRHDPLYPDECEVHRRPGEGS